MYVGLATIVFFFCMNKRFVAYSIWGSNEFPSSTQQLFLSVCERILVIVICLETKGGISVASAGIPVLKGISIITSL